MVKYSSVNNFIFKTRTDAQKVIDGLKETMDTYGSVSVADLYDLVGVVTKYTDNGYGWMDISSAKISINSCGYTLQINSPIKFK